MKPLVQASAGVAISAAALLFVLRAAVSGSWPSWVVGVLAPGSLLALVAFVFRGLVALVEGTVERSARIASPPPAAMYRELKRALCAYLGSFER